MTAGPAATWLSRHLAAIHLAGPRVLDLGCGPGRDCAFLLAAGFRVTGCDPSLGRHAGRRCRRVLRRGGVFLFRAIDRNGVTKRAWECVARGG